MRLKWILIYGDMDAEGLIDCCDYVPPQQEKPKSPSYEESLRDVFERKKQIYVDPQYFPKPLPEYEDEEIDYAMEDEDAAEAILVDAGVTTYVERILNLPEMTLQRSSISTKR